ncbi:MAG: hypothetical protein Q9205_006062 [Flavoplaca limonia]
MTGDQGSSAPSTDEPSRMEGMKIGGNYDQHLVTGIVNIGSEVVEGWSSKLARGLVDEAIVENNTVKVIMD